MDKINLWCSGEDVGTLRVQWAENIQEALRYG